MSLSSRKNIGAYIAALYASDATAVTAGSTGDNTRVNASAIDLEANGYPLSAVAAFHVKATLANTFTLSLSGKVETTNDATNGPWTSVGSFDSTVLLTGITAGTAQTTVKELDVDLSGAKRYVRVSFLPLCSRAGTDTATVAALLITAGQPVLPV